MTGGRREDDWYCTYLEEGSCLAHCYWDFLTAASLRTHRERDGGGGALVQQEDNNIPSYWNAVFLSVLTISIYKKTLCLPHTFGLTQLTTLTPVKTLNKTKCISGSRYFLPGCLNVFLIYQPRRAYPLYIKQDGFVWTALSLMGEQTERKSCVWHRIA